MLENQQQQPTPPRRVSVAEMCKRPKHIKPDDLKEVLAVQPWSNSPIFSPGYEGKSEFISNWAEGETLMGVLGGKVKFATPEGEDNEAYVALQTETGEWFRAYASGQLKFLLRDISIGEYVELTYLGKEPGVDKKGKPREFKKFRVHKP